MGQKGVFGKYIIQKASGRPLDPEACYFVLRLDTDHAARRAMAQYARSCRRENPRLARDIEACICELEDGASLNFSPSKVWRAGPEAA